MWLGKHNKLFFVALCISQLFERLPRWLEKALARDGSARLAEAARKREAAEAAARKAAK